MSNFIKRLSKSLAKLQQTVTDRLAITKHVAIFQQLEIGSQEEQDLMLATKDLQERFEEVEGLPLEVMKTMALILLDIQYVQTTKATGTEKVYSVNPVDPFEGNVETMLQYAKFLVDTHQPELTVSCMAVLLVKMASHNMAWRENESTQHGRYTLLHHYALFESIFPGKFIQGKLSDFMREKKILVKYRDAQLDKPIHHAVGFSGFQAKPAASMVNKLYCRRGKNLKNFIGDQIRSRLSVESKEEVKKLFDFFSSKCFFNEKGVMTDGNSVQLLLTHMELIQMMMNQDPQSEKYMFKIPKFEHEADIDCGPWSTLQLIPVRVKWNASCFRQGTDVEKYSVFNLNYYLNCPTMVQTLEGLTMVCYEMQIGTAKAFDALTRGHIKYDRERIFDTNANLKNFYDAVKVMKNLDAVPLNSESIQRFRAHYSAFPALTLVMNEKYVMTCSKPKQDDPLVQKIGAQGGNDIKAFNYQGSWGSNYPSKIVWEHVNTGQSKLRYLKNVSMWGSDQRWGDEGHSHAALIACLGDFQMVIGRRTLYHDVREDDFVKDYRFLQSSKQSVGDAVVLGDLSAYDRVALVIRSAPHPGHEARAYGYHVDYILEDPSKL